MGEVEGVWPERNLRKVRLLEQQRRDLSLRVSQLEQHLRASRGPDPAGWTAFAFDRRRERLLRLRRVVDKLHNYERFLSGDLQAS